MTGGPQSLTEKEKETLRLLASGYDAKSMARHLGLSVHTINERLRDARRKMAVSSSREAARQLRDVEAHDPQLLGDKALGAAIPASSPQPVSQAKDRRLLRRSGWILGAFAMTFPLAILALASLSGPADTAVPAPTASTAETAAVDAARQWLALVDAGDWKASYAATGSAFRKLNSLEQWTSAGQGAHGKLGAASSRQLMTADYSPAPPHGVWTLRFRSRFANGREVIETVALGYEDGSWRVVGVMLD
jgi:DNA-binding CsgD family transcriptional regulator